MSKRKSSGKGKMRHLDLVSGHSKTLLNLSKESLGRKDINKYFKFKKQYYDSLLENPSKKINRETVLKKLEALELEKEALDERRKGNFLGFLEKKIESFSKLLETESDSKNIAELNDKIDSYKKSLAERKKE